MSEKNEFNRPNDPASAQLFEDLASLNHQFLAVLCDSSGDQLLVPDPLRQRLCSLTHDEHIKLAACPYALFDLDLSNHRRWRQLLDHEKPANQNNPRYSTLIFALLSFASTLARDHPDLGGLLLDMNDKVCALLKEIPLGELMRVACSRRIELQIRLGDDPYFWSDLVNFVHDGTSEQYLAAQTSALQLVAAGMS